MYKLANTISPSASGFGNRALTALGLALLPLGFAAAGYRIGKTKDPGEGNSVGDCFMEPA